MAEESGKKYRPVEDRIYRLLLERGWTVGTAESCTGGLIAAQIINVPGASDIFKSGYITYANEAKKSILGVRESTLTAFGAASAQTAQEMALGAAEAAGSECSVVSTGIAGPGGGTTRKPVGLVYIACCVNGNITVKEYHFQGSRSQIRNAAVEAALELLEECIQSYLPEERE